MLLSQCQLKDQNYQNAGVSILVVMDVAFAAKGIVVTDKKLAVSILVVMDVAFAVEAASLLAEQQQGLNPCCNGCCFRRCSSSVVMLRLLPVSILVVMDVAFAENALSFGLKPGGLNPCCNGCCFRRAVVSAFYCHYYLSQSLL